MAIAMPVAVRPQGPPAPLPGPKSKAKRPRRGQPRGLPQVDPFLGWLIDDQAEQGLTDGEYAARHGLSRPHYVLCKSGDRGLSRQIVEGICKRDPRAREAYVALCLVGYGRPAT